MQQSTVFTFSSALLMCVVLSCGCCMRRVDSSWRNETVLPLSHFSALNYYTDPQGHEIIIEFGSLDSALSYIRYSVIAIRQGDVPVLEISIWGAVVDGEPSHCMTGGIQRIENGNYSARMGVEKFDPVRSKVYYRAGTQRQEIPYKGVLTMPFRPYEYKPEPNPF